MPDYDFFANLTRTAMPARGATGDITFTVVPNTNRSAQTTFILNSNSVLPLDFDTDIPLATDKELFKLVIRKNNINVAEQVFLELAEVPREHVRLFDRNRRIIAWSNDASRSVVELTFDGQFAVLFYETDLFYASALLSAHLTGFSFKIIRPLLSGGNNIVNTLTVQMAKFKILGDTSQAELLLMADLGDKNKASTVDVAQAMRNISTPFQLIPQNLSNNDAWVQDQYQVAEFVLPRNLTTSANPKRVVLNMPRFVNKEVTGNAPATNNNLSSFVDTFFPSAGVFSMADFHKLKVSFRIVEAQQAIRVEKNMVEAYHIYLNVKFIFTLKTKIIEFINNNTTASSNPQLRDEVYSAQFDTDLKNNIVVVLPRLISIAQLNLPITPAQQAGNQTLQALRRECTTVASNFNPALGGIYTIQLNSPAPTSISFLTSSLQQFLNEYESFFDSTSFGGNIEVTPPTNNLPFGKLVVGSDTVRPLHRKIKQVLEQNHGNILEIDTSWLDVGHVDEIVCFMKSNQNLSSFFTLYASHKLANKIFEAAIQIHNTGRAQNNQIPSDFAPLNRNSFLNQHFDDTTIGSHPISYLLRGKNWKHAPPNRYVAFDVPPQTYVNLHFLHDGDNFTTTQTETRDLLSGSDYTGISRSVTVHFINGKRRLYNVVTRPISYDAKISVSELLLIEERNRTNNILLSNEINDKLQSVLNTIYGGSATGFAIPLPVVFSVKKENSTSAFTPDLVNMQQIGDHVLIQRPYGPRMSFEDAKSVIRNLLQNNDVISDNAVKSRMISLLNVHNYIQNKALDTTIYWHHGNIELDFPIEDGIIHTDGIGRLFIPNFDNLSLSEKNRFKEQLMRNSRNRGLFDAEGFFIHNNRVQKVFIQENTVDLFELYCQLVLESLGKQVHWVDGWYYHVKLGGIHCGTNVLRRSN